ncbi:TPA: hypothetical protein ACGW5B_005303 [Bacillus paranthracis]|uniref:hypothetical protein n=1 Tax=Bacillus cereus group TaxID=86661 RepID=UPI0022B5F4E6|nr:MULTISPECIES: hypothetical protein [Bacillus cereus group]MCZ7524308.1 hypothetical protein [Bacillus pacificus]MDA1576567.1 hypothetical protein [Bacillus cereus group sp. TH242-3LC]MDX5863928.1 hypothetical protein [Bacillus cereus group sp. BfR-BA-02138]
MQYNPVPTEKDYEIAARNGISKANVNQRVYGYHWSVERAITEPLQNKKGKENNRHLVCIAEKNGISASTYYRRIREEGMTEIEAATKLKKHEVYLKIASENGISENLYHKRVQRGMPKYEAATKPKDKRGSTKKKQIS